MNVKCIISKSFSILQKLLKMKYHRYHIDLDAGVHYIMPAEMFTASDGISVCVMDRTGL